MRSKSTYLSGVLFAWMLCGCSQQENSDNYKLKGTIDGVNSGTVKLRRYNQANRTSTTFDSANFTKGKFELKGKLESPEMMTVVIEPGNWSFPVFLENSPILVKADTTGSEHYDWTSHGGSKGAQLKKFTISGSANQDDWLKFENDTRLKAFEPIFAAINKAYADARGNKEEAYKIKNQADSVRGIYVALQKKWIDSFITASPSTAAGAYMLNNYYMYNSDLPLKDMESMLAKYTGVAKSTVYYNILSDALKKRQALLPGNIAPDFTLLKTDSSSFTLSSLRGKYVMLDFWASWCVPCRKAIPHWKEVYKKYQPKGFEVLSITNDNRWPDWFKALEEEKMPWPQVADEFPVKNMTSRVGDLYMTPYLPTYILLDKEGRIILYNASEQEIEEKLKEILG